MTKGGAPAAMISGRAAEGRANAVLPAGDEPRPSTTRWEATSVPWWGIALIAAASLLPRDARLAHNGLMDSYVARDEPPVTAVQWDGTNVREVAALLGIDPDDTALDIAAEMARQDGRLRVSYAGLTMAADRGEWYLRDSMGGVIVMPADLFEASYQRQSEITR
jgi:hypothetical protein